MDNFDKYVEKYDLNNYDIAYKYHHCYRVQELSNKLSQKLDLNNEDKYLADIIGLLHDIGRFKQLEVYNTYDDKKSIDHAYYGVKVLFEDKIINNFDIDSKYYRIIEKAIMNHNKYMIEEGLNNQELLHAKIIRDTDKIDIFNAYTDLGAYNITANLDEVSLEVEKYFFKAEAIPFAVVKTNADELLSLLSFIYDISYSESLEIIKENDYVNKLYNQIDNKDKYKKYFEFINKYIDERIDGHVRY